MKRRGTDLIVICDSDSKGEDISLRDLDSRDRRRGYFECTYHFIIKRNGDIEHGHRPYDSPSMGLGRHNGRACSICLVGGRGDPPFTRPQIASLASLLAELQDEYPDASIKTHHEVDPKVADRGLDFVALTKDLA